MDQDQQVRESDIAGGEGSARTRAGVPHGEEALEHAAEDEAAEEGDGLGAEARDEDGHAALELVLRAEQRRLGRRADQLEQRAESRAERARR